MFSVWTVLRFMPSDSNVLKNVRISFILDPSFLICDTASNFISAHLSNQSLEKGLSPKQSLYALSKSLVEQYFSINELYAFSNFLNIVLYPSSEKRDECSELKDNPLRIKFSLLSNDLVFFASS